MWLWFWLLGAGAWAECTNPSSLLASQASFDLDSTNILTVCLTVQGDPNDDTSATLFSWTLDGGDNLLRLELDKEGHILLGAGTNDVVSQQAHFKDGSVHDVCGTFDFSTGAHGLHTDGVRQSPLLSGAPLVDELKWKLLYRQTRHSGVTRTSFWESYNSDHPEDEQYSILSTLTAADKVDGKYEFKLVWPEVQGVNYQQWVQDDSPFDTETTPAGYQNIQGASSAFQGLMRGNSDTATCLLLGDANADTFCVGSSRNYFLAWDENEEVGLAELYVANMPWKSGLIAFGVQQTGTQIQVDLVQLFNSEAWAVDTAGQSGTVQLCDVCLERGNFVSKSGTLGFCVGPTLSHEVDAVFATEEAVQRACIHLRCGMYMWNQDDQTAKFCQDGTAYDTVNNGQTWTTYKTGQLVNYLASAVSTTEHVAYQTTDLGYSCASPYLVQESGHENLEACTQFCTDTADCNYFTFFESVETCRLFTQCDLDSMYVTETQPSASYVLGDDGERLVADPLDSFGQFGDTQMTCDNAAELLPAGAATAEWSSFGTSTACRTATGGQETGANPSIMEVLTVTDEAECKALCVADAQCHAIEMSGTRCELWKDPGTTSVGANGYECLKKGAILFSSCEQLCRETAGCTFFTLLESACQLFTQCPLETMVATDGATTYQLTKTIVGVAWPTPWLSETNIAYADLGDPHTPYKYDDAVVVALVTMPTEIQDGCLWEAGAYGAGAFLGIVNGYFRVAAGSGEIATLSSDSNTAVISIALPSSLIPLDGSLHEIALFIKASIGLVRLIIDGVLIAETQTSSQKLYTSTLWAGGDDMGFGMGSFYGTEAGGTSATWPAGSKGTLNIWAWTADGMNEVEDTTTTPDTQVIDTSNLELNLCAVTDEMTTEEPAIIADPTPAPTPSPAPACYDEPLADWADSNWILVMQLGCDTTFSYDAAAWTDDATYSLDNMGNEKRDAFHTVPFTDIKVCNADQTCFVHSFGVVYPSAQALFSSEEFGSSTVDNARADFVSVFAAADAITECEDQIPSFNLQCLGDNRVRWGFCGSRPSDGCDAEDADGVIGIGLHGQDGSANGAGYTNALASDALSESAGSSLLLRASIWVQDIDECADASLYDCADGATCVNTVGSYECTCNAGFAYENSLCVDIDECADAPCAGEANTYCHNTKGAFECKCLVGFVAQLDGSCQDVIECQSTCTAGAECVERFPTSFCEVEYELSLGSNVQVTHVTASGQISQSGLAFEDSASLSLVTLDGTSAAATQAQDIRPIHKLTVLVSDVGTLPGVMATVTVRSLSSDTLDTLYFYGPVPATCTSAAPCEFDLQADQAAPIVTLQDGASIAFRKGDEFTDPWVTTQDACEVTVERLDDPVMTATGISEVNYRATDCFGQTTDVIRSVIVLDAAEWVGEWSACSTTCGQVGTKTRSARCVSLPGSYSVDERFCLPSRAEAETISCQADSCDCQHQVDNVCWYLGNAGDSCFSTCFDQGLAYDARTLSFAGSDGTGDACDSVLATIHPDSTPNVRHTLSTSGHWGIGCAAVGNERVRDLRTTTEYSQADGAQRACACRGYSQWMEGALASYDFTRQSLSDWSGHGHTATIASETSSSLDPVYDGTGGLLLAAGEVVQLPAHVLSPLTDGELEHLVLQWLVSVSELAEDASIVLAKDPAGLQVELSGGQLQVTFGHMQTCAIDWDGSLAELLIEYTLVDGLRLCVDVACQDCPTSTHGEADLRVLSDLVLGDIQSQEAGFVTVGRVAVLPKAVPNFATVPRLASVPSAHWAARNPSWPCSEICGEGNFVAETWECAHGDQDSILADTLCSQAKPELEQPCSHGACEWVGSAWSACQMPGMQDREVSCQAPVFRVELEKETCDSVDAIMDTQYCNMNECLLGFSKCHAAASCVDEQQGYACECMAGYQGDGRFCEDIDECQSLISPCNATVGVCENSAGSYACTCAEGYWGDGVECALLAFEFWVAASTVQESDASLAVSFVFDAPSEFIPTSISITSSHGHFSDTTCSNFNGLVCDVHLDIIQTQEIQDVLNTLTATATGGAGVFLPQTVAVLVLDAAPKTPTNVSATFRKDRRIEVVFDALFPADGSALTFSAWAGFSATPLVEVDFDSFFPLGFDGKEATQVSAGLQGNALTAGEHTWVPTELNQFAFSQSWTVRFWLYLSTEGEATVAALTFDQTTLSIRISAEQALQVQINDLAWTHAQKIPLRSWRFVAIRFDSGTLSLFFEMDENVFGSVTSPIALGSASSSVSISLTCDVVHVDSFIFFPSALLDSQLTLSRATAVDALGSPINLNRLELGMLYSIEVQAESATFGSSLASAPVYAAAVQCMWSLDCPSKKCSPCDTPGIGGCSMSGCSPPSCDDGVQNQGESDVDCGGPCPNKCGPSSACLAHVDCSGFCEPGYFSAAPLVSRELSGLSAAVYIDVDADLLEDIAVISAHDSSLALYPNKHGTIQAEEILIDELPHPPTALGVVRDTATSKEGAQYYQLIIEELSDLNEDLEFAQLVFYTTGHVRLTGASITNPGGTSTVSVMNLDIDDDQVYVDTAFADNGESVFLVQFPTVVVLESYDLISGASEGRDPVKWRLHEADLSVGPWTVISDVRVNVDTAPLDRFASIQTTDIADGVQFVKFEFTALRGPCKTTLQLSEIHIFVRGELLDGVLADNPNGKSPGSQGAFNIIDHDMNSQFVDENFADNGNTTLVLQLGGFYVVDAFEVFTGSQFPERDPIEWVVSTSTSADGPWTVRQERGQHDSGLPFATSFVTTLPNHDFETGDLSGWVIHTEQPAGGNWVSPGGALNENGACAGYSSTTFSGSNFVATNYPEYEACGIPQLDLRSVNFGLGGDGQIDFLLGGMTRVNIDRRFGHYGALFLAEDDSMLMFAEPPKQNDPAWSNEFLHIQWDASAYVGFEVYLRFVDMADTNWHMLRVDDVNAPVLQYDELDTSSRSASYGVSYLNPQAGEFLPHLVLIETDSTVVDGSSVVVYRATGRAKYERQLLASGLRSPLLLVADINGDLQDDIILIDSPMDQPMLRAFLNAQPLGQFEPQAGVDITGATSISSVVAHDLNSDGQTDVLVATNVGLLMYTRSEETGDWEQYVVVSTDVRALAVVAYAQNSDTSTLGNEVIKRLHTDEAIANNLCLDADLAFDRDGYVTGWEVYMSGSEKASMLVLRPEAGSTTSYSVVCQNEISPDETSSLTYAAQSGGRCAVQKGDVIGWQTEPYTDIFSLTYDEYDGGHQIMCLDTAGDYTFRLASDLVDGLQELDTQRVYSVAALFEDISTADSHMLTVVSFQGEITTYDIAPDASTKGVVIVAETRVATGFQTSQALLLNDVDEDGDFDVLLATAEAVVWFEYFPGDASFESASRSYYHAVRDILPGSGTLFLNAKEPTLVLSDAGKITSFRYGGQCSKEYSVVHVTDARHLLEVLANAHDDDVILIQESVKATADCLDTPPAEDVSCHDSCGELVAEDGFCCTSCFGCSDACTGVPSIELDGQSGALPDFIGGWDADYRMRPARSFVRSISFTDVNKPVLVSGFDVSDRVVVQQSTASLVIQEVSVLGGLEVTNSPNTLLSNVDADASVIFTPPDDSVRLGVQGYLEVWETDECFKVVNSGSSPSTCSSHLCAQDESTLLGRGSDRDPLPHSLALAVNDNLGVVTLSWEHPCPLRVQFDSGFVVTKDGVEIQRSNEQTCEDLNDMRAPGHTVVYCVSTYSTNAMSSATDAINSISYQSSPVCLPFTVPFMAALTGTIQTREIAGERYPVKDVKVCFLPLDAPPAYGQTCGTTDAEGNFVIDIVESAWPNRGVTGLVLPLLHNHEFISLQAEQEAEMADASVESSSSSLLADAATGASDFITITAYPLGSTQADVASLDFVDISLFEVPGRVSFGGDNCPVVGAQIFANRNEVATSDAAGQFILFLEIGVHEITAEFGNHSLSTLVLEVTGPMQEIVLIDSTTHTLDLTLGGGTCNLNIGGWTAQIFAPECQGTTYPYEVEQISNAEGSNVLVLPAHAYNIKFVAVSDDQGIVDPAEVLSYVQPLVVDLFETDVVEQVIYHNPYEVLFHLYSDQQLSSCSEIGMPESCSPVDPFIPTLNQDRTYEAGFELYEMYGSEKCPQVSATVDVDNHIAGDTSNPEKQSVTVTDGFGEFTFVAGPPAPFCPFTKLITWRVRAEGLRALPGLPDRLEVLVLGDALESASFYARGPESMPLLILRDPPGDQSSTTWEMGTELSFSASLALQTTSGYDTNAKAGFSWDPDQLTVIVAPLGIGLSTPLPGAPGLSISPSTEQSASQAEGQKSEHSLSMASSHSYTTSQDEGLTAGLGDLYIGGTLVFPFATTKRLHILGCDVQTLRSVAWGFPTISPSSTYVYTELEIIRMIATLKHLQTTARHEDEYAQLQSDIDQWKLVIETKTPASQLETPQMARRKIVADQLSQVEKALTKINELKMYYRTHTGKKSITDIDFLAFHAANLVLSAVFFFASANGYGLGASVTAAVTQANLLNEIKQSYSMKTPGKTLEGMLADLAVVEDTFQTVKDEWQQLNNLRVSTEAEQSRPQGPEQASWTKGPSMTFSALEGIEGSTSISRSDSTSWDLDLELGDAMGLDSSINWPIFTASSTAKWASKMKIGGSAANGNSVTNTIKYSLGDDDEGDKYFIAMLEDPVYGVPAFIVESSETMCPCEDPTDVKSKCRGAPLLEVEGGAVRYGVSPTDGVEFTLKLRNLDPEATAELGGMTYTLVSAPNIGDPYSSTLFLEQPVFNLAYGDTAYHQVWSYEGPTSQHNDLAEYHFLIYQHVKCGYDDNFYEGGWLRRKTDDPYAVAWATDTHSKQVLEIHFRAPDPVFVWGDGPEHALEFSAEKSLELVLSGFPAPKTWVDSDYAVLQAYDIYTNTWEDARGCDGHVDGYCSNILQTLPQDADAEAEWSTTLAVLAGRYRFASLHFRIRARFEASIWEGVSPTTSRQIDFHVPAPVFQWQEFDAPFEQKLASDSHAVSLTLSGFPAPKSWMDGDYVKLQRFDFAGQAWVDATGCDPACAHLLPTSAELAADVSFEQLWAQTFTWTREGAEEQEYMLRVAYMFGLSEAQERFSSHTVVLEASAPLIVFGMPTPRNGDIVAQDTSNLQSMLVEMQVSFSQELNTHHGKVSVASAGQELARAEGAHPSSGFQWLIRGYQVFIDILEDVRGKEISVTLSDFEGKEGSIMTEAYAWTFSVQA